MLKRSAVVTYFAILAFVIVAGAIYYGHSIYQGANPYQLNMAPISVLSFGGVAYLAIAVYRSLTTPVTNPCVLFRMSEPYLEIPVMIAVAGVAIVYSALLSAPIYVGGVYTVTLLIVTQHATAHWSWIIHGANSTDELRRSQARSN